MTESSDRKIVANRKNGRKSRGPKSSDGKRRSSRNAYRHGLAVQAGSDPSINDDVEILAKAIAVDLGEPHLGELSRSAAAAAIELFRIRRIRAALFNAFLEGNSRMSDSVATPRSITIC